MFQRRPLAATLLIASGLALHAHAVDWPQYQGDAGRSAVAGEALATPLECNWVYQATQLPRPAWEEPGREAHRLDFDFAPQPVIAGGRVFFGSSADDTVRALDLASGKVVWRFTTGGPVRFAPAVAGERVYATSDDGWLYCLETATGAVVWRFRAAPGDDLLLGNGRMISRWPLRSGVAVVGDTVYTVAGMWPGEGIYVYALDAETGAVRWRNDSTGIQYVELPHPGSTGFSGVAPQGYLAVSGDVLIVPTGRACPAAFDRNTGEFLYCWPHRSWDDAKRGGTWLTTTADLYFNPTREPRGTSDAYVGEMSPLPNDGMVAYEIATNKPIFTLPGKHRVVVSGDTLYAVGNGEAAAYDLAALRAGKSASEARRWTAPHLRVYSLTLAGDTLFIGGSGVLMALDAQSGARKWHRTENVPGGIRGLAVGEGCLVAATDQGVLTCFSARKGWPPIVADTADWRIAITRETTALAEDIVQRAGAAGGYALVLGSADVQLAAGLARKSPFHVIHLSPDETAASAAREALMHTDFYGTRVAVVAAGEATRLPLASYFADLIVISGDASALSGSELYRMLRPCGGLLLFAGGVAPGEPGRIVTESGALDGEIRTDTNGCAMICRGPLPGAGEWRCQWADGGRTGIGEESRLHMPLGLLWFGGPGPNRMMDRHFGTSTPLSVNGRVFLTGERHVIAYDAYNGRELWAHPLRGAGRMGAMWYCANIAADNDMVYVAAGAACHRIDQATGTLVAAHGVPEAIAETPVEWQYVGVTDDCLLGSCRAGNSVVFAVDKRDGVLRWQWRAHRDVPQGSVAYGDGRLYCLDIEPPDDQARRRGVIQTPVRSLIALDLATGAEVWRRDDVPRTPSDQVQYADGVVSVYANVAYDANSGEMLWQKAVSPERPPLVHGDWIIAQPNAYALRTGEQRMVTDSVTGEQRPWEYIQSYGCGGVNGCETMLFFRSGVAGFYDFENDATTTFGGIRVGCSTNVIAANGLAILPETSSGCACTYNFQTSIALAPEADGRPRPWFAVAGRTSSQPFEALRLNLGAPGDRRDADGALWLGVPRPILSGVVPVAVTLSSQDAKYFEHADQNDLAGLDKPWLYGSGVQDPGRITIELIGRTPAVAWPCDSLPAVDGILDKALKNADAKSKIRLNFSNGLKQYADVYLRHAADALYVGVQCFKEEDTPWTATQQGEDARVWEDDSWEVYLSDSSRDRCVHLGVSASGARFDGLWDCRVYEALRGLDRAWNGAWTSAAAMDGHTMTVELAIPLSTLASAGLDTAALCIDVLGTGPGSLGSPDFLAVDTDSFCVRWSGAIEAPESQDYTFTVRADQYTLLKIDDETIITHNGNGTPSESSATIALEAGQRRRIAMFYEEAKGPATMQLFWSSPSMEKALVPSSVLYTDEGTAGGLSAAYGNRWFEEPILTRVDATIDFDWGEADLNKIPKAQLMSPWGPRPRRCEAFLPLSVGPVAVEDTYTVRLHFAEIEAVEPGQRVFNVNVQDKPVLENFDVVAEAQGRNRPIVKTVTGVIADADARIHVELAASDAAPVTPFLNAIEIAAE